MSRYLAIFAFISLFTTPVLAADSKMSFAVNHRRDPRDNVIGSQLIFRLKEEVRKSSQLDLTASDANAVYSIDVSTLVRADEVDDPAQVMYAATLSVKDTQTGGWLLLDQTVGYAGRDRLQDAATGLMVWIDENVETAVTIRLAALARALKRCESDGTKTKETASL